MRITIYSNVVKKKKKKNCALRKIEKYGPNQLYHAMGNVLYNRCAFYPIPMNKKEKKKKEKKKKKLVLIRLEFSIEIEED